MVVPRHCLLALSAMCAVTSAARAQQGRSLRESEPNNGTATATPISLGDSVTGFVNPVGDRDYFALDLAAGTHLDLVLTGSVQVLTLLDGDGETVLRWCCEFHDPEDSLRIVYTAPVTGRYYVKVPGASWEGGPEYPYSLKVSVFTPLSGPGDPTTLVAPLPAYFPQTMAAGASGDMFVAGDQELLRVSPTGTVTTFLSFPFLTGGLAFDGFGDLLAAGLDGMDHHGVIWRISPSGERSVFAITFPSPLAITVGPDGDVWLSGQGSHKILRFDPLGALKQILEVGVQPLALAFSPTGELHFTAEYTRLYKLANNAVPQLVLELPGMGLLSLAFDRDGFLYLANTRPVEYWRQGTVVLVSPSYQVVNNPFAGSINDPLGIVYPGSERRLAFARDGAGNMTARLLATTNGMKEQNAGGKLNYLQVSGLVAMNPAGIRAPGARVGVDLLPVALVGAGSGALGAPYANTLQMSNAPDAVTWTIESGLLPPGVTLSAATGVLAGTPSDTGSFTFSVRAKSGSRYGFGRFTILVAPAQVSIADITNALLGAGSLSPAVAEFLDRHGNGNGILDVGDLRAYLRAQGRLP